MADQELLHVSAIILILSIILYMRRTGKGSLKTSSKICNIYEGFRNKSMKYKSIDPKQYPKKLIDYVPSDTSWTDSIKNKAQAMASVKTAIPLQLQGRITPKTKKTKLIKIATQGYRRREGAQNTNNIENEWSGWSECSEPCGIEGIKERKRINPKTSKLEKQTRPCNRKSCHGPWGGWSSCSKKCGFNGTQTKMRRCLHPSHCEDEYEQRKCAERACLSLYNMRPDTQTLHSTKGGVLKWLRLSKEECSNKCAHKVACTGFNWSGSNFKTNAESGVCSLFNDAEILPQDGITTFTKAFL